METQNRQTAHVLFLNHVSKMGGAERSLLDMVTWLHGHGWFPSVVLPEEGELAPPLQARHIPIHTVPMRRLHRQKLLSRISLLWTIIRVAPRLGNLARRRRIALLHANSNTAHLYAIPAARYTRLPLVWHCRDTVRLGVLGHWMVRRATRVVAISRTVANLLQEYGASDRKIQIVYNGIDTSRFVSKGRKREVRIRLKLPEHGLVVAMIAQLVPWKNHHLFLLAARLIANTIPRAIFLVVGDDRFGDHPSYRTQLEALARETGIAGQVIFTGFVEDIATLLEAIDVLVHPAANEPFGRCIVEAMSMGKPVVAVRSGGPAELVRDEIDGLLVPPDNAEALAGAVIRLAHNPEMASSMGKSGRERVVSEFNLDQQMQKIETIYHECLC